MLICNSGRILVCFAIHTVQFSITPSYSILSGSQDFLYSNEYYCTKEVNSTIQKEKNELLHYVRVHNNKTQ